MFVGFVIFDIIGINIPNKGTHCFPMPESSGRDKFKNCFASNNKALIIAYRQLYGQIWKWIDE
jgi:hypothetical protein